MPFNFLRRESVKPTTRAGGPGPETPARVVTLDAFTDEWHLTATVRLEGRLSDALNRREPIEIADVAWAPIDGSAAFSSAPELRIVDPYDLVIVVAGADSLPELSEAERVAHRVHKVPYDVLIDVPPYRIVGTVTMRPGAGPERLTDRASELFVPILEALVLLDGTPIADLDEEVVLVNRSLVRSIEQVDGAAARAELLRGTRPT